MEGDGLHISGTTDRYRHAFFTSALRPMPSEDRSIVTYEVVFAVERSHSAARIWLALSTIGPAISSPKYALFAQGSRRRRVRRRLHSCPARAAPDP